MSHPPETSLTSRELAERISETCLRNFMGIPLLAIDEAAALINAWVRVWEAIVRLDEAELWDQAGDEKCGDEYINWAKERLASATAALATARKQQEGAAHDQAEAPSAAASANSEPGGADDT